MGGRCGAPVVAVWCACGVVSVLMARVRPIVVFCFRSLERKCPTQTCVRPYMFVFVHLTCTQTGAPPRGLVLGRLSPCNGPRGTWSWDGCRHATGPGGMVYGMEPSVATGCVDGSTPIVWYWGSKPSRFVVTQTKKQQLITNPVTK